MARAYLFRPTSTFPERAPNVVADLCSWLAWKGYIPESEMEAAIDELGAQAFSEQQNSVNF